MDGLDYDFEGYIELFREGGSLRHLIDKESQDVRLSMYALGRQGKLGDVQGSRPGMFSPIERAKWDAWEKLKGMDQKVAQEKFCALGKTIVAKKK
jgi:diazepam-binding inhibitor (GABA receptor modulating acyl-CoA-binding protein)